VTRDNPPMETAKDEFRRRSQRSAALSSAQPPPKTNSYAPGVMFGVPWGRGKKRLNSLSSAVLTQRSPCLRESDSRHALPNRRVVSILV
jgi:hypothetical protein